MKTEFKYIHFIKGESKPKATTEVWYCHSNKTSQHLATIKWNGAWKKYCFYPRPLTIFDAVCLEDIIKFIRELERKRRDEKVQSNMGSG